MLDIEKLKEILESEEGKKASDSYRENLKKRSEIKYKQLKRFHEKFNEPEKFSYFVEKVLEKYDSDEYRKKWWNLGYEPPEKLKCFLFEYSEKYGRECNKEEWDKYSNDFTSNLYYINGWYFNLMIGQGSFIKIEKKI